MDLQLGTDGLSANVLAIFSKRFGYFVLIIYHCTLLDLQMQTNGLFAKAMVISYQSFGYFTLTICQYTFLDMQMSTDGLLAFFELLCGHHRPESRTCKLLAAQHEFAQQATLYA